MGFAPETAKTASLVNGSAGADPPRVSDMMWRRDGTLSLSLHIHVHTGGLTSWIGECTNS